MNVLRDDNIADVLKITEEFVPMLQRSIDETRAIYMGLRPKILEDFGVTAALWWNRDELLRLYPAQHIEMDITAEETEIPKHLDTPIFRVAQEALNNAMKHSQSEWIDLSLSMESEGIQLIVSDDGIGMDSNHILQSITSRSLGLTSMRERVEMFGGRFSIQSARGEGTKIMAWWPIAAEHEYSSYLASK